MPYRDHRLDISGPVWGLNAQGLYYIDRAENQLWRLDLTTGEETLLYEAPTLSPGRWDRQDRPLWETLLEDIHDTAYDAALFLDQVTEDTVTLTYRYTDGSTTDTLVLDSRTGGLLSKTRNQAGQWTQYVGDRAIAVVLRTQDPETGQQWVDLQEEGVSLLPAGAVAQAPTAAFQGGLLAWYTDQGEGTGEGAYLLLPQAGAYTPCPSAQPGRRGPIWPPPRGGCTTPPGRRPAAGWPCGPGTWPQGRRFPCWSGATSPAWSPTAPGATAPTAAPPLIKSPSGWIMPKKFIPA